MKRELISQALSDIDDKYISESVKYRPAKSSGNTKIVRRIVVLAAVVALLMALGATAYAKGWLGLSPLVVPTETPFVIHGEEHQTISISQPQAVPEDLPEVNELAENNKQAWQEFQDRIAQLPETLEYNQLQDLLYSYDGKDNWKTEFEDNGDGTITVSYNRLPDDFDPSTWNPTIDVEYVLYGTKDISTEDYERFGELVRQRTSYQCEYDFHYWLYNDEEKAILEDVAANYGLNLRKEGTYAYWDQNGKYSGNGFYSNTELVDMTSAFCKGNIFYSTPRGL
jgi:hypothetical protein